MADLSCPCGRITFTQWDGRQKACPICGRVLIVWADGRTEWIKGPVLENFTRIRDEGQGHFQKIHREMYRLKKQLQDVRRSMAMLLERKNKRKKR